MKRSFKVLALMGIAVMALSGCGAIDSGNSGVRISWDNKVVNEPVSDGFYTAIISSVEEWVGKEILIELENMEPKVGDNLKMQELDVQFYYKTDTSCFAGLKKKYANSTIYESGYAYPAFKMITGVARTAVYEAVGGHDDSLTLHKFRNEIASNIVDLAQSELEAKDPSCFTVTRVLIKKANTDKTLEESIQLAIKKDKELEAAEKDEDIQAALARANSAITTSLTPEVMRMKELAAMVEACQKNTCIIDFTNGNGATPLINIK
jgi:hypothetical protein